MPEKSAVIVGVGINQARPVPRRCRRFHDHLPDLQHRFTSLIRPSRTLTSPIHSGPPLPSKILPAEKSDRSFLLYKNTHGFTDAGRRRVRTLSNLFTDHKTVEIRIGQAQTA